MSDWKFELETTPRGITYSRITQASQDTASVIKHDAPLIDDEVRRAAVIVRLSPDITVKVLRTEAPILSSYASDEHLVRLITDVAHDGDINVKDFTDRLINDAAVGHSLGLDTIRWYRTHGSRQKKALKRGRPRKKR